MTIDIVTIWQFDISAGEKIILAGGKIISVGGKIILVGQVGKLF